MPDLTEKLRLEVLAEEDISFAKRGRRLIDTLHYRVPVERSEAMKEGAGGTASPQSTAHPVADEEDCR